MLIPLGILAGAGGIARAVYFGGGQGQNAQTTNALIEKFASPTDVRTILVATFGASISGRRGGASSTNSGVAGYAAGGVAGNTGLKIASVEKLLFSTETVTTLGTSLNEVRDSNSGMANSGVAGYVAYGHNQGPTLRNDINKITFSTDTVAYLTNVSTARISTAAFGNPGVAGYIGGGFAGSTYRTTHDKCAFPSDTFSTTTALPGNSGGMAGFSNPAVAGYYAGSDFNVTTVLKYAFPSDTLSTLGTGLSVARGSGNAASVPTLAGYVGGGFIPGGNTTVVDKFAFPSDTRTTLGTGFSIARGRTYALGS